MSELSLPSQVAAILHEIGEGTIDDLQERLPNYSRKQLSRALSNGNERGLVWCIKQERGGKGGRPPGVWSTSYEPRMKTTPARLVFDLGSTA
jgi:predicted transcriptional regulator